jgi:S1-C subfamily serine protease
MRGRNSVWVSVLGGGLCLAVGAAIGSAWPALARRPLPAAVDAAAAMLPSFANVVERIGGGVVTVHGIHAEAAAGSPANGGERANPLPWREPAMRSGSGFVVDARGLVLTCRHVVADAEQIAILLPGRRSLLAELVGEDPAADLALLRIAAPPADLQALVFADDGELRVGDWIVALGSPLGYAHSVTAGIVSFVGRHLLSDYGVTTDFLQISAPMNPGSSGCPVVDLRGRVVGLTTRAPEHAQGISFAVPSRTLRWAVDAMRRQADGRVRRGYLGIEFTTFARLDDDTPGGAGAVIVHVVKDAPADRAGVQPGDVITAVGGRPVVDANALHEHIACAQPGTSVALRVRRGVDEMPAVVAVLGEVGARRDTPN